MTNARALDTDQDPATLVLDRAGILAALDGVKDPEIPVVSVVELGIVQDLRITHGADGSHVEVDITPTFSGCPALEYMRSEIAAAVRSAGAISVTVNVVLTPPWTSDRISPVARERMRSLGLEPPPLRAASQFAAPRFATDLALGPAAVTRPTPATNGPSTPPGAGAPTPTARTGTDAVEVACPYCGSMNTRLESAFGATICRTLHHCNTCQQGFEAFKAL